MILDGGGIRFTIVDFAEPSSKTTPSKEARTRANKNSLKFQNMEWPFMGGENGQV